MLTPEEQRVIDATVELWNSFLILPVLHSDDITEFRYKVHEIQRLVLSRPTIRILHDKD